MDPYELILLAVGLVVLLTAWLPARLQNRPLSLPIVLVAIGAAVFALPLGFSPDRVRHGEWFERCAELGVLVSLTGAGLKLDRPLGWRRWASTWRLLGIGMPVTILLVAAGGLAAGLPLATAVLVGAAIAPTDPVLAAEVQVGEPTVGAGARGDEDEVRFTLTSEAGLNDGLAFPFVYAAIALAASGGVVTGAGVLRWFAVDVVYKLSIGVAVGAIVGVLLGRLLFSTRRHLALAESSTGFVALAAMLLAYGAAEVSGGYGFLAVFVTAVTIRATERGHRYHRVLHDFVEEVEQLLVVGLLVLLGGALVHGLLVAADWKVVAVGVGSVFLARPIAGRLSLLGSRVEQSERRTIALFGIRGIGSFYYLAYAATAEDFADIDRAWAVVAVAVLSSILVHGVAAAPVMAQLDRRRARRRGPPLMPMVADQG